jgi:hypothetical protein
MHRAADDADIIDGIRQPRLRRNLLFHGQINLPVACLGSGARGIALRALSRHDAKMIRGPHRAVGSSPRRVESLRLRTHIWSMLGEIGLDPSPQPDKNG